MQVITTKRFAKSYSNLNFGVQQKVDRTLQIFIEDPENPILKNHKLHGGYTWYKSINVTWDVRIIFHELSTWYYELVELVDVGTHNQLYE